MICCPNKLNELDGKVGFVFVDGKIAAESCNVDYQSKKDKFEYQDDGSCRRRNNGADEFTTKPISVVDKVYSLSAIREPNKCQRSANCGCKHNKIPYFRYFDME